MSLSIQTTLTANQPVRILQRCYLSLFMTRILRICCSLFHVKYIFYTISGTSADNTMEDQCIMAITIVVHNGINRLGI